MMADARQAVRALGKSDPIDALAVARRVDFAISSGFGGVTARRTSTASAPPDLQRARRGPRPLRQALEERSNGRLHLDPGGS